MEISENSRVWIYQSNRQLQPDEEKEIVSILNIFTSQWQAHGTQLTASSEIRYNRFIILIVDESLAEATGCSIDKSVNLMKELKQRILEVYLNVIEMGDGIYGAEAATQTYFNKNASSLTKRQAALLIAILPNPLKWSPVKPTKVVSYKQNLILRNMRNIKRLNFE